jgi:hypothetical protein
MILLVVGLVIVVVAGALIAPAAQRAGRNLRNRQS